MDADLISKLLFFIAVIDPIGSVSVYLDATKGLSCQERRHVAIRGPLIGFGILLFFILIGQPFLEVMNVSLEAFQVAGGVILFLFALTMIFGESKPESEKHLIKDYKNVTIFPIAIPSIASPGAIMATVIATDNYTHGIWEQAETTVLVFIAVLLSMICLLGANLVKKAVGEYGITVISKIMGLVIAAYACQSILEGLKAFFI